jgi:signal transduction histidine kinase
MATTRQWRICAAVLVLLHIAAALILPNGPVLVTWGDVSPTILFLLATAVMVANGRSSRGATRLFWVLMAIGSFMWATSQSLWTLYEVILRRPLPDPFVGDVILFVHVVPFMAAVALRPHRPPDHDKVSFSTLNFLMLLVWWVFLYAFVVFPDEYVSMRVPVYSRNFDLLYLLENLVLLGVLGALALNTRGAWNRIYWNFLAAFGLYSFTSEAMNVAIARGSYHTGCIYDVPFVASICWLIWTALLARELNPASEAASEAESRWLTLPPRLAMLAILSLPMMGYWASFVSHDPIRLRHFRLLVSLAAMLVLGLFLFVRQYLLDRELIRLLEESRQSFGNLQRLQTQLVQKEKLASLGQLVAGAAHEINNPLTAILGYSELLASHDRLDSNQVGMAQKIAHQARRTRDLVSGLLSFAQRSPGEKGLLDLGTLLRRAIQMEALRMDGKDIRAQCDIANNLPRIVGDSNQLFQCCLQIIGNAIDSLEDGGGVFTASARHEGDEIILELYDSGPEGRQPQRVPDPLKPVRKGIGLGLSVAYGIVQDHNGHISCEERVEGGTVFVLRFPVANQTIPAQPEILPA